MIARILRGALPYLRSPVRALFATLKRPSLNPTDMLVCETVCSSIDTSVLTKWKHRKCCEYSK